jgi:hypothetical protein
MVAQQFVVTDDPGRICPPPRVAFLGLDATVATPLTYCEFCLPEDICNLGSGIPFLGMFTFDEGGEEAFDPLQTVCEIGFVHG